MGVIHTNTVESAFSLLKRGIVGSWHKVSAKHLSRYQLRQGRGPAVQIHWEEIGLKLASVTLSRGKPPNSSAGEFSTTGSPARECSGELLRGSLLSSDLNHTQNGSAGVTRGGIEARVTHPLVALSAHLKMFPAESVRAGAADHQRIGAAGVAVGHSAHLVDLGHGSVTHARFAFSFSQFVHVAPSGAGVSLSSNPSVLASPCSWAA
jgi:hypothetical protein